LGKPIPGSRNIINVEKRSKLQKEIEQAGKKFGVDIKKINKEIQGSTTLAK
jgi:hypothetical protein